MEWKSIKTAPWDKDLLLYDFENKEVSVGRHSGLDHKGESVWNLSLIETVKGNWDTDPYRLTPTHWMLLPELPK